MSGTEMGGFEHREDFLVGEVSAAVGWGPLEAQYQEMFAEVLEDGIITTEERARLERAADNLGLDRGRLLRLEQAMVAAYEAHHRVKVVESFEAPRSLMPLDVRSDGDAGRALLLSRIAQLEARVLELEEELRRANAAAVLEVDLTDLDGSAADVASEDVDEVWRRVRRDPWNERPLRELYRLYSSRNDVDGTLRAAQALAALGKAQGGELALVESHAATGLIAPRGSVSPTAWTELLFHSEQEQLTGQIFAVIAPAVLLGRVSALRRDGALPLPNAATKQNLQAATVTAVRAIPWAAAVLGLPPPTVYLEKDQNCGYQHVPGVPPHTVLGRGVLSGRTQTEHAFLVGRHLTFYRSELFIKTLFQSVVDLEDLFLAALTIGNPGLPVASHLKERVAPIAAAIEPLLEPAQIDSLRGHFLRFVEEGGRTNLQRWSSAVEKTACRAGLTLASDLAVALRLLEAEDGPRGERAADLVAFSVSERYGQLRKQLGVAAG